MGRMDQHDRAAIICQLVRSMRQADSWAGQTHIQKTVLFLQEMLGVPLGYKFILYKYGPFSFDLREELALMRASLMLDVEPNMNYGPSFMLDRRGKLAVRRPTGYEERIEFIAQQVSAYDVQTLERLSTTYFVRNREPDLNNTQVAARVTELKPHISPAHARDATLQVDELFETARSEGLAQTPAS